MSIVKVETWHANDHHNNHKTLPWQCEYRSCGLQWTCSEGVQEKCIVSLGVRGKWSTRDRRGMSARRKSHSIAKLLWDQCVNHTHNHIPQPDAKDVMNVAQGYMTYNEDVRQNIPYTYIDRCCLHRMSKTFHQLCHHGGVALQDI